MISKQNNRKEYMRKYEQQPKRKLYRRKKMREYATRQKLFILNRFGNKCAMCGIEYNGKNSCIFDFHHTNPNEKEIAVSDVMNLKKLEKEIVKGILVCANCHRLIHHLVEP